MTKFERHPAPEKLLLQVTIEAVNLLALGGQENTKAAELPERGVALIVKAWGLPQGDLEASLALIQRQKELIGTSKAAMPDDQLLEPYDGGMLAELVWGLFETAVRLEDAGDRAVIHRLALMLTDMLDFDDWIKTCGPTADTNK